MLHQLAIVHFQNQTQSKCLKLSKCSWKMMFLLLPAYSTVASPDHQEQWDDHQHAGREFPGQGHRWLHSRPHADCHQPGRPHTVVVIWGYVPQGAEFYTRYNVYVIQWQRTLVVYMSLGQLDSWMCYLSDVSTASHAAGSSRRPENCYIVHLR